MNNKTPHTRDITLKVIAHRLFFEDPIPYYINPNTSLVDDEGFASDFGDNNRNYKTEVYLGYDVVWHIEVADKKDDKGFLVKLYSISQERGSFNFFDAAELTSKDNGKTIRGTIKNTPPIPDMDDYYTIYFAISNNKGATWQYYPLDPRLRIKQSITQLNEQSNKS